jgi:ribosome-associated protein
MIRITDTISIDPRSLRETFSRSSGPGGQNVNKVATAVELRFDLANSLLPEDMKQRLAHGAKHLMTNDGELVIMAQEFRSQERNREAALARLMALLRKAAIRPRKRIPTRPTRASKTRRLDAKARHSVTKALRRTKPVND